MGLDLNNIDRVHCVGIGGIGVSALARLFTHRGGTVTGSDTSSSPITEALEELGIFVSIGHDKNLIDDSIDLVIRTIAVPEDNPEIIKAKDLDIPVLTYPQALGVISQDYYTVAVSGTHGKTTTTAMIAKILHDTDQDPTVIVGSFLHDEKSNFIAGDSDILVVEACEYRRSFLELDPNMLVITNVDVDHLDYYDDLADIQSAFEQMAGQVADDGFVICEPETPKVSATLESTSATVVDYADVDIDCELEVPGEHNRENARAAVATTEKLGVDLVSANRSVCDFRGTWRRAQKKGEVSGAVVFDDYGHHPTEIDSTLRGFKNRFPDHKLVVCFQPHLYSRTKEFLDEFADSLSVADRVFVLPIYAARETPDSDISSADLVEKISTADIDTKAKLLPDFSAAAETLTELVDEDTLILTQGAGDVYQVADRLIQN